MENLKFRRQFLFSSKECLQLGDWQKEILGSHVLYVHKECELSRVDISNINFIIIGYVIDPKNPTKTTFDILSDIANLQSVNSIPEYLYGLVGRFILIIKNHTKLIFYNDACGLKTLYYTKYENGLYAASQPLLLKLVIPIKKATSYEQYFNSDYVKKNIEHWLPVGSTLYQEVYHLAPNHYFDSSVFRQIRYFPNKPIKKMGIEEAIKEYSSLLKKTMLAANIRFKLALPITAGLDSRIILSACKEIAVDIYFYTLQYRSLTEKSDDIKIPVKLLSSLGFQHHVIDCRKTINKDFETIYINNTDIHHLNDWGFIANGMYNSFPQERVAVKGNCSEIGRCAYYYYGKHKKISSYKDFIVKIDGWKNIPFIKNTVSRWYENIKEDKTNYGYDLFDLFYWEHRMGSWQAQSQLEWDIVQDEFTPFNNRELLDIMLSVDTKYRVYPDNILFKKSIELLWKDVLKEPINPIRYTFKFVVKKRIKRLLIGAGIFYKIKLLIKKIKNIYKVAL